MPRFWPGLFAFLLLLTSFPSPARADTAGTQAFIGKLKEGYKIENALTLPGLSEITPVFNSSNQSLNKVVKFNATVSGALGAASSQGLFEYVERDQSISASDIYISDPGYTASTTDFEKQWWLAKVKIPNAWEINKGSRSVTVAVVDTGINGQHEDLSDGRVGGGYVSYCQSPGSGNLCAVHVQTQIVSGVNSDDNGHGTLVAGIIGAVANNGKGIAGVNWDVRLMPIKALDSTGNGVSSDVAAGIVWAADNGANIINLSLGGNGLESNKVLSDAIAYAFGKGVLIVAAAGNDSALIGTDLDSRPVYPICLDQGKNMVLGVTATDAVDRKADFSNFGRTCVDISAPGTAYFSNKDTQKGLLSTYTDPKQPGRNNLYAYVSGTSIAAPIVSGVGALLKNLHPDLAGTALRDRLIASVDPIDEINSDNCAGSCAGKLGSGRVNALAALQSATLIANSLIADSNGSVYLISDGFRRPMSDFVLKQRSYPKENIRILSSIEIELLPLGTPVPPQDGTIVKAQDSPTAYVVADGTLRPMSYLAFKSAGYSFAQIQALPPAELAGYQQGPQVVPGNGALLKLSEQPAVYIMNEGKQRLLSYFVFRNRGLNFTDVVEVERQEFDRYPQDATIKLAPPLDGTLLKSSVDPTVYVVEGELLRPLSAAAFTARGYQFTNVKIISQGEVVQYRLGAAIL